MVQLYVTMLSILSAGKASLDERISALREEGSERGAVSLEQVIITAGLLTLGLAVVAGITAAVTGRLGSIF